MTQLLYSVYFVNRKSNYGLGHDCLNMICCLLIFIDIFCDGGLSISLVVNNYTVLNSMKMLPWQIMYFYTYFVALIKGITLPINHDFKFLISLYYYTVHGAITSSINNL